MAAITGQRVDLKFISASRSRFSDGFAAVVVTQRLVTPFDYDFYWETGSAFQDR